MIIFKKYIGNLSRTYYLVGNLIVSLTPMILLPYLARIIEVESYGAIAVYQSLTAVFVITSGSFIVASLNRGYYSKEITHEGAYSNAITASIFITILLFVVSAMVLGGIYLTININENMFLMLCSAVTQGFFTTLVQIRLGQYQIRQRPESYVFIQIGIAIINVVVTIILVDSLFKNEWGRILPQVLAVGIFSCYSVITLLRNYYSDRLSETGRQGLLLIKKGTNLIPHMFVSAFLISIDKIIVASVLGLEAAGVYFVCFQLARALDLVNDGVNKSLLPYVFERMRSSSCMEFGNIMIKIKIVNLVFLMIGIIFFGLIVFFGEVIVGTKYKLDLLVVMFFCLGFVFKGWYLTMSNFMFYFELNKELSKLSVITLIFSVALSIIFSLSFGLEGAALAFMIGMFLRFFLTNQKVGEVTKEFRK